MSNIYIQEPPTSGKVVMRTTLGDIEIELWSKEAPLACRNFVQLCLEGYYDRTIFHRLVPSFVVQGGDPTGTGFGGESIYPEPFRDELHSRLRFVRRGLLAMANSGEKNSNGSQFFFTLAATPDLENKHTIFGKVVGDTIYNLLKFNDGEVDANERPVYPHKIIQTEVLTNPFPDIQPRTLKPKQDEKQIPVAAASGARATKNFGLLSFGDEAEEEEEENTAVATVFSSKPKSSHDLANDPRLSSQSVLDEEADPKGGYQRESRDIAADSVQKRNVDFSSTSVMDQAPIEVGQVTKVPTLEEAKRRAAELMDELTKPKPQSRMPEVGEKHSANGDTDATVAEYKNQLNQYESIRRKKGENREEDILKRLQNFKTILKTSMADESDLAPPPADIDLDTETGTSWMKNKLSFEEERLVLAKDASLKADDWYDLYDPRNPINRRKREGKNEESTKRKKDSVVD
ncbi:spliceosome-associated protein CWC27 homolog [Paramacrobiotus metropolitanus]|uniref:spliceosome-associated protein CWC27 homolog n=1 Tax=Paramacrobiotus metropolitanus TaxID=2943436 RepID=UPI0024456FD4|nr:spliceosome-associated protein CWC27 homolog [Paramacrobiotus metropolitanus]XP_055334447.1 spliceosome-associated protein CWC27 homolog [Paramacrobiotus metropolitanus]XP_055334449.1 spliceosome-associated protein CWC27 homolog [Paramacrobiotus metropolitanus]